MHMPLGGTIHRKGGPDMAEIKSPGGPLSTEDQIFRDRPRIYHKRRVYGLPRATYVAMLIAIFCKTLVRAIWVSTRARDFKFAGAIVQRL